MERPNGVSSFLHDWKRMRNTNNPPLWSISKAYAAQLTTIFAILGLVEAVGEAAPVWSASLLFFAVLSGGWWCYRWLGDRRLAQNNRLFHTTLEAQHRPARTSQSKKPNMYAPEATERPYRPATRS